MNWEIGDRNDSLTRAVRQWSRRDLPLTTRVGRAEARFYKTFAKLLKEWQLIPSEWAALRELQRPLCWSPVELGHTLGMSKGGASKLIDRLVRKGYVQKATHKFDRRFRSVGLSSHGKRIVPVLATLEKDIDREFFRPLGNNRRFRLAQWLTRVLDAGQKIHMDQWVANQLEQRRAAQVEADHAGREPKGEAGKSDDPASMDPDTFWDFLRQMAEAGWASNG
jgi:DNA-binding MarR family transcriptional regulator